MGTNCWLFEYEQHIIRPCEVNGIQIEKQRGVAECKVPTQKLRLSI